MFDTENALNPSLGSNTMDLNEVISNGISPPEFQPWLNYTTSEYQRFLGSEFIKSQDIEKAAIAFESQSYSELSSNLDLLSDNSIVDSGNSLNDAGNTLNDATEIILGENPATYNDWVGDTDPDDYYRVSLAQSSNFELSLQPDAGHVAVQLLNSAGWVLMRSTNNDGTTEESIQAPLLAGTYYIRVEPENSWDNTDYNLTVFATPVNDAGNTLNDAKEITLGENPTTYRDSVAYTDPDDYYSFSLAQSSNFELSLQPDAGHVDVQLLDSAGRLLMRSKNNDGTTEESIQAPLLADTYYIRVEPENSWDNTDYELTVSATPVNDAGNTLNDAKEITLGENPATYRDSVAVTDTDDYYRFSLTESSNFELSLQPDAGHVDVQLLDSAGRLLMRSTNNDGTTEESIQAPLLADTYYIRVEPENSWDNTDYTLTVSASTIPVVPGYSIIDGFGLVNAASAVAQAIGGTPFADVPDLGGNDWGADLINVPEVWAQGFTGEDIVLAVLDTGVDRYHPDLIDNILKNTGEIPDDGIDNDGNGYTDDVYGWNFDSNTNDTLDVNGHGTHVAGTIAALNNGFGVTGIAYDAKIMPVKVLSDIGSGLEEAVADGILYAVDNGAKVINMSLGGPINDPLLRSAVEYAASQGVITVMASGNDGDQAPLYPANYATDWGIAVGAVDQNSDMAYFSNRSGLVPKLYRTAPGVNIESTVPNNRYGSKSGTSMATPHVAAVVALMLNANPELTPDQVRQILSDSAIPGNQNSNSFLASTNLASVDNSTSMEDGVASQYSNSGTTDVADDNRQTNPIRMAGFSGDLLPSDDNLDPENGHAFVREDFSLAAQSLPLTLQTLRREQAGIREYENELFSVFKEDSTPTKLESSKATELEDAPADAASPDKITGLAYLAQHLGSGLSVPDHLAPTGVGLNLLGDDNLLNARLFYGRERLQ